MTGPLGGLDTLLDLRERMNQLFDDLLHPIEQADRGVVWTPLADVSESNTALRIEMELPGVDPDQVEVEVEPCGSVVHVRGDRPYPSEPPEAVHRMEGHYGSFHRAVEVGPLVRLEGMTRRYDDGVLVLELQRI